MKAKLSRSKDTTTKLHIPQSDNFTCEFKNKQCIMYMLVQPAGCESSGHCTNLYRIKLIFIMLYVIMQNFSRGLSWQICKVFCFFFIFTRILISLYSRSKAELWVQKIIYFTILDHSCNKLIGPSRYCKCHRVLVNLSQSTCNFSLQAKYMYNTAAILWSKLVRRGFYDIVI